MKKQFTRVAVYFLDRLLGPEAAVGGRLWREKQNFKAYIVVTTELNLCTCGSCPFFSSLFFSPTLYVGSSYSTKIPGRKRSMVTRPVEALM